MSQVEPRLAKIIATHLGVTEGEVKRESRFIEDLGSDSLDVLELLIVIEDEYGIKISDDEAGDVATVQEAALLIDRLVAAEAVPAS